ncbi:MAG: hypothetical protein ACI8X5_003205 [Planctomycetota bacterium]|jgi:hypothetical protein
MLKFTHLFNFGLVGALVVPSVVQQEPNTQELTRSLQANAQALEALEGIQGNLKSGDYSSIEAVLKVTEAPTGGERERSETLDRLRQEIGALENQVQEWDLFDLDAIAQGNTSNITAMGPTGNSTAQEGSTGHTEDQEKRTANTWPSIENQPSSEQRALPIKNSLEKPGFTADAVRQGRANYRAGHYTEALKLFTTRKGEPEADYWMGRSLERLSRTTEAVTAYTRVIDNEKSGVLAERAAADREFLSWLIDFDRKVSTHQEMTRDKK